VNNSWFYNGYNVQLYVGSLLPVMFTQKMCRVVLQQIFSELYSQRHCRRGLGGVCSVHIIAQNANRYIAVFHIAISYDI